MLIPAFFVYLLTINWIYLSDNFLPDLELNLSGTGTETIYFAWRKGMFLRAESNANIKGSADNEEMGVSIPMDHEIETITTVNLD